MTNRTRRWATIRKNRIIKKGKIIPRARNHRARKALIEIGLGAEHRSVGHSVPVVYLLYTRAGKAWVYCPRDDRVAICDYTRNGRGNIIIFYSYYSQGIEPVNN